MFHRKLEKFWRHLHNSKQQAVVPPSCVAAQNPIENFCAKEPIAQGKDAKENSQAVLCRRALHAWLALAQRPKELKLFKAEHKAETSGDTRILSQQLRGPVKGQGSSKCFAGWTVPSTHLAGWGKRCLSNGGTDSEVGSSLLSSIHSSWGCVQRPHEWLQHHSGDPTTFIWRNWEDL